MAPYDPDGPLLVAAGDKDGNIGLWRVDNEDASVSKEEGDGSEDSERRLLSMLHWDVNNGIARRSWARNDEAQFAIRRAMKAEPKLKVTLAQKADADLIRRALS